MLTLRRVRPDDAERLLAWRNDPATVAASLDARPVGPEEHRAWLARSLASADRELYIAERAGEAIGTVRYDRDAGGWELSWTLAPEARGRGLGRAMVIAALDLKPASPVRARIKTGNQASRKLAEAAGFRFLEEREGVEHWARANVSSRETIS